MRARLLTVLAIVTMTAGPALVIDATPAASESEGPTGYTTLFTNNPGSTPDTCTLAKIEDLGSGGAVAPIGAAFDQTVDGCPLDLAIRNGDDHDDQKIWGVIEHGFNSALSTSESGLPTVGASDVDGLASTLATGDPSVLITIDQKTGARTTIGPLGFASVIGSLAFDDEGTLWFYAITNDPKCVPGPNASPTVNVGQCLYRLDPKTGAATFVADGPTLRTTGNVVTEVFIGSTATCNHVLANVVRSPDASSGRQGLNRVNTKTASLIPKPDDYGDFNQIEMSGIEHGGDADKLWTIGVFLVPGGLGWGTFTVNPETGAATKAADVALAPTQQMFGLAISGLSCEDPDTPPATAPPVVIAEPSFTG